MPVVALAPYQKTPAIRVKCTAGENLFCRPVRGSPESGHLRCGRYIALVREAQQHVANK
jgi:hypothetical protein